MWIKFNNNPTGRSNVGDCAVRAVSVALNISWEDAFWMIAENAFMMGDIMSSNVVLGSVLRQHGFKKRTTPDTCPECYTFNDFCEDHPQGIYVLCTGNHVATVIDGTLYDSWNSSDEMVDFYWEMS